MSSETEQPLAGIADSDIEDKDILLGRGGKTNHHPGNASYLKLIEARQVEYMFLESRTEKTEYAMQFVLQLRKEGIRFLKKDDKDGKTWSDVGDFKMREKVSQNLREHQPTLKKQLAFAEQSQPQPQPQPQSLNHQLLLQQQQFLQMQALAQQNKLQTQQLQMQLMIQQQQQQFSNLNVFNQTMVHNNHMSSLTSLPENTQATLNSQNEAFQRDSRAFAKQQYCANRDHPNFQSSSTIPDDDNVIGMPLQNIAKPSLAARCATLTDIDVAVALGNSNHSLLDSLHIQRIMEEEERDISPKPNQVVIDQVTPSNRNKGMAALPSFNRPAPVTPTPSSPRRKDSGSACILDNDMLRAWANTVDSDDDDDEFANDTYAAFARRSLPNYNNTKPKAEPFRRAMTAPVGSFRSTSPPPPRAFACAAATARPSSLTMTKRATSNVNETPETRGHLRFEEPPLGSSFEDDPSNSSYSSSVSGSISTIKKAALGRDRSEQSRLLKQQCMPHVYGPATGSFSDMAANGGSSLGPSLNGWPTKDAPDNSQKKLTPKSQRVLQDFGKMVLSTADENDAMKSPGSPGLKSVSATRTATRFEGTIAGWDWDPAEANQIPMTLMVNKPLPLMLRNRTSTIEALDLDSLEDDTVLQEERDGFGNGSKRRPSRNSVSSIAAMWASMPTSDEFEALVSDITGQQVADLSPASLSLPNLKA